MLHFKSLPNIYKSRLRPFQGNSHTPQTRIFRSQSRTFPSTYYLQQSPFTPHIIAVHLQLNSTRFYSIEMFTKALLLLALSLTTLSLPTTNESLEKRSTKAWIGCFEETDEYCQNGVFNDAHPRPKLGGMNYEDCLEFTPTTQRFGMWNHQLPSYLLATRRGVLESVFHCNFGNRDLIES